MACSGSLQLARVSDSAVTNHYKNDGGRKMDLSMCNTKSYSKEQVAIARHCSVRTVDRMLKNGTLGFTKIGRSVLIPESELNRLLTPTFLSGC
jgi:excisionase family DNA binding protein